MDLESLAVVLLGFLTVFLIIMLLWYILYVIGSWKIFTKAGEAGWKSIIPFYNTYTAYKICWNTNMFWIMFACMIIGNIVNFAFADSSLAAVGSLFGFIGFIFSVLQNYKLSLAFGHGVGFAVGLVLLNPIFIMILGFGSSEYIGPQ